MKIFIRPSGRRKQKISKQCQRYPIIHLRNASVEELLAAGTPEYRPNEDLEDLHEQKV